MMMRHAGTLHDGSQFDSSRERGFPFTFNIGFRQVIRGEEKPEAELSGASASSFAVPLCTHAQLLRYQQSAWAALDWLGSPSSVTDGSVGRLNLSSPPRQDGTRASRR